jgi:putative aldouronate transport system permease protein
MKLSRGEKIFEVLNMAFLVLLSAVFLIPFLVVFSTSFMSQAEYATRGSFILWPTQWDLEAYQMLLDRSTALRNAFAVTLFRVTVGTFLNLAFTSTMAYVLARRTLPGRTFLTLVVFATMLFGGGLIPTFMVVDSLKLTNSVWALVVPSLVNAYWMLLLRNFFMSIPGEIEEAAIVDGASPPLVFVKIILPLSTPALATIGLFYAVNHWNAWFDAAIYIFDPKKQPVQLLLRGILSIVSAEMLGITSEVAPPAESLKSALIIVATVPILLVYPFIQRFFVKGIMVGSIKG